MTVKSTLLMGIVVAPVRLTLQSTNIAQFCLVILLAMVLYVIAIRSLSFLNVLYVFEFQISLLVTTMSGHVLCFGSEASALPLKTW